VTAASTRRDPVVKHPNALALHLCMNFDFLGGSWGRAVHPIRLQLLPHVPHVRRLDYSSIFSGDLNAGVMTTQRLGPYRTVLEAPKSLGPPKPKPKPVAPRSYPVHTMLPLV
jgi:hypothetical protein